VLPSGDVRSAGAAAEPLARLLPGGTLLAFIFARFPRVTQRAYAWVADHRDGISRLLRIDSSCTVRRVE
jgi:predicted DCC family thiol-disulfide oxidoreductase YuxK